MSIWNKTLLGCIAVTALLLFVLSARALQAHRVWHESYNKLSEAIAKTRQETKDIVKGNPEAGKMGLREVRLELYKLLIGRGRVWDNNLPVNVQKGPDPGTDPPQERVLITVQTQEPDAIEAKAVVYAFEYSPPAEGEEVALPTKRGAYLGQFTVTQVGGNQIILQPSVRLSDSEFARVQASQQAQTPWRLYELMPTDDHEVLADLTDEEKKLLFPSPETFGDPQYSTINDYLYDGKILLKEEAEKLGLNGKIVMVDEAGNPVREEGPGEKQGLYKEVESGKGMFIRALRDYRVRFDEEYRIRSSTIARIRAAQRDLRFLKESLADSAQQQQFRQKEIQDLGRELASVSRQRDAVLAHESALDRAIASMKTAIADLIARNDGTVAQIARIQSEAARIISARTAEVAQASGP